MTPFRSTPLVVATMLGSIAFASPLVQTPATAPSTPPAQGPKIEMRSSWKDVDPALLGPVRPLLVDRPELRITPSRHFEFDRNVLGSPGGIVTLSKTPHFAVITDGQSGIELRTVHRETGAVSDVITRLTLPTNRPVAFDEAADGVTVIVRDTPESPVLLIDAATATIRATLPAERVGSGDVRTLDDTTLVVMNRASGRVNRIRLADGSVVGTTILPPFYPIDAGGGRIIAQLHCDPPNPVGVVKERRMLYVGYDATSGKEVCRLDAVAGLSATGARSPVLVVGEIEAGWAGMRCYDPLTLVERRKVPMVPVVHSFGLEVTPDGRYLVMLEYRAQPVIFWDTSSGAAAAVLGPERGGYIRFDISNDGKIIGGIVGPWVNGNLIADAFEWTELANVPQLKPAPSAAAATAR